MNWFHFRKLGFIFACFSLSWAQFMTILYGFAVRHLFGGVFLQQAKQRRLQCAVSTYNWSIKNSACTVSPWKRQVLKGQGVFRISDLFISSWVIGINCNAFLVGKIFESVCFWESCVRSGDSITTLRGFRNHSGVIGLICVNISPIWYGFCIGASRKSSVSGSIVWT